MTTSIGRLAGNGIKEFGVINRSICLVALMVSNSLLASPGPTPAAAAPKVEEPKDRPYPGTLQIAVEATDLERRIVHVKERLTGMRGDLTLLYPRWLPGDHAPTGHLDRFAGLRVSADGAPLMWVRDAVDVNAFHVQVRNGVQNVAIEFDYLSPTSDKVGGEEISRDLIILEWPNLVLYPAGYYMRQIPVEATVVLPADFKFGSALEAAATTDHGTSFKATNLETLLDSPIYGGRYGLRLDLTAPGGAPVHLNAFADRPDELDLKPEHLAALQTLVVQANKLFSSHHYAHYDFLVSLSDGVEQNGLEHHQSSEDGLDPMAFAEWDKYAADRDLLPHEYTHSWNGKFRRPADLWTPNLNVPMRNSLLWVYEGQTDYWGDVLAARSGLRSRQEALDELAYMSAWFEIQSGREWRPLQDTVNDEIINPRRPMSWRDYQRFEDYYAEGAMIWLDADTLIRELSEGRHSLDDFARRFFGTNDGSFTVLSYTFDDVVKTLNDIQPYDWRVFLRSRLDSRGTPPFFEGLRRGGYKLAYSETESEYLTSRDAARKRDNFFFSIGLETDKEGLIRSVIWNSPAFKAHLTEGMKILAVDGHDYSADALKRAITAAKDPELTLQLIVHAGDFFSVADIDYHGGLRYPKLERDSATPARLDEIFAARP